MAIQIPDDTFGTYRAVLLGGTLLGFPPGVPVLIEIEDADGNVIGTTDQLYVARFENASGEPTHAKIIGRVKRPSSGMTEAEARLHQNPDLVAGMVEAIENPEKRVRGRGLPERKS